MAPDRAKEVSSTAPAAGTAVSDPAIAAEATKRVTVKPRAATPAPASSPEAKAGPALATVPGSGPAGEESGLPWFWIGIAALISMIGIAGFFIGRRMWWAHQNPNLFRKYD